MCDMPYSFVTHSFLRHDSFVTHSCVRHALLICDCSYVTSDSCLHEECESYVRHAFLMMCGMIPLHQQVVDFQNNRKSLTFIFISDMNHIPYVRLDLFMYVADRDSRGLAAFSDPHASRDSRNMTHAP